MDVRLSPEQDALRDSAAKLVADLGPASVADLDDRDRVAKLDAAVAAAGWRELRTASEAGGPWASAVDAALVAEELGRGLADTAFLGPSIAAELRRLAGVGPSAAPEAVAFAPGLGHPAVVVGALVDGALAVDAAGCASALALASAPGGHRLAELRVLDAVDGVDLTRVTATVGGAAAAKGYLSDDDLTRVRAFGLALTCADLVGTMRGAIDLATGYAAVRHQYGVPVGSFQAVQHLLADALVAMEGSRSVALYAAWGVDALGPQDALTAAAVAKAYCARAARTVGETAIQVHGGIGNTWDCLAHVYLRRSLLSCDLFGGVGPSLDRVQAARGIGAPDGLR
jgi:alkylation response protein AidB-like acyl-CoA dehydrogenase